MVSGEDSTERPLRAATPPEDVPPAPRRGWLSRPRRPRHDTLTPPAAPTADGPAADPPPAAGTDVRPEPDVQAATGGGTGPAEPTGTGGNTDADGTEKTGTGDGAATGAKIGRRRRVPFAHAVRLPPPRQAVGAATRATRAWSRRPSGRLTLPGLFLFALVAATAAVGAVVVPSAVRAPRPVAVDDSAAAVPEIPSAGATTGVPVFPGVITPTVPLGGLPSAGVVPSGPAAPPAGRPADALGDWARVTGSKVGVSPIAMQAYGYAELVLAQTNRSCQLSWTTLAAIGYVESRHGQANGATLGADGRAVPEIIGDPLDGKGGRSLIRDTDGGLFDRDTVYDRAIGPMQFIPTTWQQVGADADNDGRKDPHDLDDAALAAGNYLCQGGRNMTIPGDWWGAILSYNDVRRYAQDVFDKAQEYGRASRT
ncbi:lytic transglycosylase domain-containing protein [Micromonospora sp. HUAS LYJ1]|uniref:lytic transglycosylase domain-containing protein n=1 Tax=Micromonospora sp. HUAS LYJ1 TaxID=3061626 RepID=UPI0026736E14|nr:lytic transglycosylase domain-containing protein [Micromonospora sp. HUAS LYJ1]WKU02597.1 lytic transglycosylase domain-containing protein [Micromonospora sp. HUAS LYJ1]